MTCTMPKGYHNSFTYVNS